MRRRDFITLIGCLAGMWPLDTRAQLARKAYRIGILTAGPQAERAHLIVAFKQGLQELGYVEGAGIVFEIRSAEGRIDRLPDLAQSSCS